MLCRGYSIKPIKSPAHVSGSRNKWNTKISFFSLRQTEEGEGDVHECYSILSGHPLTLHEHPLLLASRGWSSPAILPPQEWTENLTVNSPTLQPLNHVVDEISCQNVSIYAQVSQTIKGIQKFKISKFAKIRNRTQDLLVVCVTKRLTQLGYLFIYKNNKSENINLNGHHLGIFFSVRKFSVLSLALGYFFIDLAKNFNKISNTFLKSENL